MVETQPGLLYIVYRGEKMKFSEKIQKLRKEYKLSQEQLADQLDVSRQAVSKWESGQTYPEMDKLISICKLFKCSLDDLTNDEIKEISKIEKEKITVSKLIDEALDTISRSVCIFKKLSFGQTMKYILELFILILILILLQLPVGYIYQLGANIFNCLKSPLDEILCSIWKFILSISYLIFAIICFYYLYKTLFLKKWEQVKETPIEKKKEEIENEKISVEPKKENIESKKEELHVEPRNNHPSVILKILNSIVSFFVKLCLILMLFPFLLFFFCLIVALIIGIYLMFQGITYFGIFLLLLGGLTFSYLVIEIIFNIIVNHRNSEKKIGMLLLISFVILGMGSGISLIEFTGFTYNGSSFPDTELYKIEYYEKEINMKDMLTFSVIGAYNEVSYEVDPSLKDTVLVQAKIYKNFNKIYFEYEGDSFHDEHQLWIIANPKLHLFNPKMKQLVFNSLKEKTIYDLRYLGQVDVTIVTSEENIEQLIKYEKWKVEEETKQNLEFEYEIFEYQKTILEKEEQISQLENKIDQLEVALEETKRKIQEYKDQISSIITE